MKKKTKKKVSARIDKIPQQFFISAMRADSKPLGALVRHASEKKAVEHAKNVIALRARENQPTMDFFVLKVVSRVEVEKPAIRVVKLGR